MHQLLYQIAYQVGACLALLLSRQSLPLWFALTVFYVLKGA
jgi:hypothetical protein